MDDYKITIIFDSNNRISFHPLEDVMLEVRKDMEKTIPIYRERFYKTHATPLVEAYLNGNLSISKAVRQAENIAGTYFRLVEQYHYALEDGDRLRLVNSKSKYQFNVCLEQKGQIIDPIDELPILPHLDFDNDIHYADCKCRYERI